MKTRNLAIVFVDIVDFTRITSALSRDQAAAWTAGFTKLGRQLARRLGGRVIKSLGDALLLTFESPTDALLFAMAIQDSVHQRNLERGEPQMQIRVAVNVGEVRCQSGDVLGEPVNVAARLEAVTPPGAIWLTESTYLAMTRAEVPAEPVGPRRFKGVVEPVTVYRVVPSQQYQLQAPHGGTTGEQAHPAEPPAYPYGGLGLQKLSGRGAGYLVSGWLEALANSLPRLAERLWGRLARAAGRPLPWRRWLAVAGVVLLATVVAVVAWPEHPFADVARALDDGNPSRALRLIESHRLLDSAEGQVWHARVMLAQAHPRVAAAGELLAQAVAAQPTLLTDSRVVRDLVACLDQPQPVAVMRIIAQQLGSRAGSELARASRSRRYWLRWNSIRLMQELGLHDDIDLGQAYLLDLQYAGSCSTRKRAARQLAKMRERRALPALQQAKQRGLLENLCMGDALDHAIKTISSSDD